MIQDGDSAQLERQEDSQQSDDEDVLYLIDNPLHHLHARDALKERGRQFARLVDPEYPDYNLFEKAVGLAYDPAQWESVGIKEFESRAVQRDREAKFWEQPRPLKVTIVAACFSAIVQGFCQSILNGSNVTLPEDFGLKDQNGRWTGTQSLWIFAGLNAIVYLSAGLCGCWISDPLQWEYLGRRYAILASSCLCFASIIGSSFTTNWQQLMVCRALLGCGLGAKASVTPIFCAEVSPSHLRGALSINWQVWDAFGIFLGFSAGLGLSSTGMLSWRLQTASACIPTAALMLLIWTVPESPRWLLRKELYQKAFESMCTLRHSRLQAAAELIYANEQVQIEIKYLPKGSLASTLNPEERDGSSDLSNREGGVGDSSRFQKSVAVTTYWLRIWLLFGQARIRRATVAAAVVMICQQLCGINVLAFYGTTFFRDINGVQSASAPTKALWMSWGIGLANFVFAFPAYYWIDRKGRRFLLLVTYPGMILAMFGACLSLMNTIESTRFVLVCIFMFIFVFFYSFGQGPVAFAYASEVFPLLNREAGMSFSVFVNLTGAGLLTLLVPQAQITEEGPDIGGRAWQMAQVRLLAVFTVLNVVSFVLIFCLVPDTAGATIQRSRGRMNYMKLEELNYIFDTKTAKHLRNRWLTFRRMFSSSNTAPSKPHLHYTKGGMFNAYASERPLDHVDIDETPFLTADIQYYRLVTLQREAEHAMNAGNEVEVQVQEIQNAAENRVGVHHRVGHRRSSSSDRNTTGPPFQNESQLDIIVNLANTLNGLIRDLRRPHAE